MKKGIKVLLINLCLRPYMAKYLFPVGLCYIASAIHRARYDMELLDLDRDRKSDEELRKILRQREFDVVAFGCIVTGYKIVKNIANIIREVKKNAVIICGNSVADSIPRILLENTEVDIAVIGEGDVTIVDVLDRLNESGSVNSVKGIWYEENGKIIANPIREPIDDIDSIPFPEWDLFDMEEYIKIGSEDLMEPHPIPKEEIRPFIINTARGCPFRCSFCYQVFQHYKYRHRSTNSVITEIKELQGRYGINYIFFSDELSFYSKKQLEEFADRLLSEDIKIFWFGDCRSNLFTSEDDLELLKKVKNAGCLGFGFSLESANREILKAMNKGLSPEDFSKQKKLLDMAGLATWTSLVFGYPQETKDTIKETMDLCYELNVYPSSGYLLPQPGSPMYDYIIEKRIITDEEEYLLSLGDRQDLRINLTELSDDEFQKEIRKHLLRISNKLELGLSENGLIKTGDYKVSKTDTIIDHELCHIGHGTMQLS